MFNVYFRAIRVTEIDSVELSYLTQMSVTESLIPFQDSDVMIGKRFKHAVSLKNKVDTQMKQTFGTDKVLFLSVS